MKLQILKVVALILISLVSSLMGGSVVAMGCCAYCCSKPCPAPAKCEPCKTCCCGDDCKCCGCCPGKGCCDKAAKGK